MYSNTTGPRRGGGSWERREGEGRGHEARRSRGSLRHRPRGGRCARRDQQQGRGRLQPAYCFD